MKKSVRGLAFVPALFLILSAQTASIYGQTAETRAGEIARLQDQIERNSGKWVAGETSVSNLPESEWLNLVGLSVTAIKADPLPETYRALPASMDWRSENGNYVTNVRHQQKCGSCWAFAMAGALESYVLRTRNMPGVDLDLSEQVMLSCSGAGTCQGGQLNANFLQKTGLPAESAYPYTAADGTCSSAAAGWQKTAYKIDGWGSVSQSLSSIKSALASYGPLPIAMMVYEDFMHYKSGVYTYTTGKRLGGHAVILVGYNDQERYFIVKNSWGTGWGENGFFRIDYSELNSSVSFGLSAIAYKYTGPKNADGDGADAGGLAVDTAWTRTAPLFESMRQWVQ